MALFGKKRNFGVMKGGARPEVGGRAASYVELGPLSGSAGSAGLSKLLSTSCDWPCFPLFPPLKKGRPRPRRGVRQARRPALGAGDRQDRQASRQPDQVAGGFDNKGYRGHQGWPESGCF